MCSGMERVGVVGSAMPGFPAMSARQVLRNLARLVLVLLRGAAEVAVCKLLTALAKDAGMGTPTSTACARICCAWGCHGIRTKGARASSSVLPTTAPLAWVWPRGGGARWPQLSTPELCSERGERSLGKVGVEAALEEEVVSPAAGAVTREGKDVVPAPLRTPGGDAGVAAPG